MSLSLPLLSTFIAGILTAGWILARTPLSVKPLLCVSLAFPLGFGVCSLFLFWALVLNPAYAPQISVFFWMVYSGAAIYWGWRRPVTAWWQSAGWRQWKSVLQNKIKERRFSWGLPVLAGIFLAFQLVHYFRYFVGRIVWNIYGGWDAQYFWNLKAKFMYRQPAEWQGLFSSVLDWAHPDYPLLLPGAIAAGWHAAGNELLIWPPAIDLLFVLSFCFLIVWYLGTQASWTVAFLAGSYFLTVPMYRFWSTTQYADIPLGFFFSGAAVFLICARRFSSLRLFFLSGICTGLAAWTKNEGLFFIGWMLLLLSGLLITQKNPWKVKQKTLLIFLLGLAAGLSATGFAKMFLGLEGGEYLGSGRSLPEYWNALWADPEKTRIISMSFLAFKASGQWLGLWLLASAALVLSGPHTWKKYRWIFPALILMIETGYFVVLHWAPSEIRFQISVSLLRLLLHTGGLAVLFLFETAYAPFRRESTV